jgi:NAD(P)-dependent dehydrogenase (short-subunit alcohol dehydrogenase family)
MGILDGKVAVITGSGGGIGKEHALYFAKEGAKVVVNDLGGARDGTGSGTAMADSVVKEIKDLGGEAVANYDSVATSEGARSIIQTALDNYGKIDILINNAGILRDKTMLKMTEEMWDAVLTVHLKGTFLCTQVAATHMKDAGWGRIINTTSIAGLIGNFGQSNYGSAKAGIAGFTRVTALELRKYGVTVNAIAPVALTRMTEDVPMFKGATREMMGPQYIAPVAAFLASDLASGITGMIVGVQGRRIHIYKMVETQGVTKSEGMWTPQEIKERWAEITK